MKFILLLALLCMHFFGFTQYIGVRARYTETRLVDDSPNPRKPVDTFLLYSQF